jgi:hypothetical protein
MAKAKSKLQKAKEIASKLKKPNRKKSSVERYSKQGQSHPQSKVWTEPSDEGVSAKPIGWRFTTEGAKRLKISNPKAKPSKEQIEKYSGKTFTKGGEEHRYIYQESRVDKSDKSAKAKFKSGGQTSPQSQSYKRSADKKVEAKPVGWRFKGNNYNTPTDAQRKRDLKKDPEDRRIYFENRKDKSDYDFYDKLNKGGAISHYKVNDEIFIDYNDAMNYCDKHNLPYSSIKKTKKYMDGGMMAKGGKLKVNGIDFSFLLELSDKELSKRLDLVYNQKSINAKQYFSAREKGQSTTKIEESGNNLDNQERAIIEARIRKNKMADGGMMAKGGFSGRQYDPYNKALDGEKTAKPVGYRFTDKLAKRLGKSVYSKPTNAEKDKYLGRGVYWEGRQDKSDLKPTTSKTYASFKSGGATFSGRQYNPYNKALDGEKTAKPVGYRFTDRLAKRLGKSTFSKPTKAEVEKYLGRGVYWEGRQDKSDLKPTTSKTYASFEYGGMARGGVERISNQEAREYTENMIPFKANNLEGKLLDNGDYVVLSYGYYPIWWYCKAEGKWYGNSTKYSVTTSKQMSQSRPTYDATMLNKDDLDRAMMKQNTKFEDGGALDLLADTSGATLKDIGGTTFSNADLTSHLDMNANPNF